MSNLYLGDAFGWQSENIAKVAISQLGDKNVISDRCRKAQLIHAQSFNIENLGIKILGYIPFLNIIAGSVTIYLGINERGNSLRPHHNKFWFLRGVSMIVLGPLLIVVDLIKTIHDQIIARKYINANPELIDKFNVLHTHNEPGWPGHPVDCN